MVLQWEVLGPGAVRRAIRTLGDVHLRSGDDAVGRHRVQLLLLPLLQIHEQQGKLKAETFHFRQRLREAED